MTVTHIPYWAQQAVMEDRMAREEAEEIGLYREALEDAVDLLRQLVNAYESNASTRKDAEMTVWQVDAHREASAFLDRLPAQCVADYPSEAPRDA